MVDKVSFGSKLKLRNFKRYVKDPNVIAEVEKVKKHMGKDKYPNATVDVTFKKDRIDVVYINGDKKYNTAPIWRFFKRQSGKDSYNIDRYATSQKTYREKYKGWLFGRGTALSLILKDEHGALKEKIKQKFI